MIKRNTFLFLFIWGFLFLNLSHAQQTNRMFFVGNSVTDAMNYDGLKALAESRGNTHVWAREMIPGSPLELLWDARASGGFTVQPFGSPTNAFAVYQWDILSLQPFDRSIEGPNGDRTMFSNFYNLIKAKSPDSKIFNYAHWPRVPNGTVYTAATKDQYNTVWLDQNGMETRKFFEDLTTVVRADYPSVKDNVIMVPLGEVFYSLNNNQAFLDAAGITSIWGVYADGIHLKGIGSYIVACTMYAMAYQDDPAGLGVPGTFGSVPAAALPYIHQTIKDVILAKSTFTKIDYFGLAPVKAVALNAAAIELNIGKTAVLLSFFTPSNAANKNVTWSSSDNTVASINNGIVTANITGTADIKVITEDGGFEATCIVTVTNTGVPVTGISLNKTSTTILVAENETFSATIVPANATNKNIIWTSTDANIATVDASGKITAVKKGAVTINAISVNGLFIASASVTVTRTNNPPLAVLKYTPGNYGYAPYKVAFDGRSSSDPDPGDFVLGYDWIIKKQGASSNLRVESSNVFEQIFTEEGLYDVMLQAVDNDQNLRSLNTERVTINVLKMPVVSAEEKAICYEGFDYVKAPITNFNGGRGWKGGWNLQSETENTINDFAVSTTSPVTIQNLKQTGNYMILGQGYSGCGRGLDITVNGAFKEYISNGKIGKAGTTLWFSIIIRPQNNNKDCSLSFSDESIYWLNNTNNSHKVNFGSFGGNYWCFSFDNNNSVKYESSIPVINNTAAFLVAKIEFGSTNKVSLYVNPTPGTLPTGTPVEATTTNSINFQAIAMNFSNGSNKMAADEIRFGASYADVAPISDLVNAVSIAKGDEDGLVAYPNPAVNQLNLNFNSKIGTAYISILDLQGRNVITKITTNVTTTSMDVSGLSRGVYFVKVVNGDKIINTRFVKNK